MYLSRGKKISWKVVNITRGIDERDWMETGAIGWKSDFDCNKIVSSRYIFRVFTCLLCYLFAFHRNAPPPFSFHSLATNLPEIEIVVSSLKKKKKREKLILAIRVAAVHRSRFEIFECGEIFVVVANRYPKRTRDILHRVLHRVVKQNSIFLPRLDVIRGN